MNKDRLMEFRHILKGNEADINKGAELVADAGLVMPKGYSFAESLLYQIGIGEASINEAANVLNNLNEYLLRKY